MRIAQHNCFVMRSTFRNHRTVVQGEKGDLRSVSVSFVAYYLKNSRKIYMTKNSTSLIAVVWGPQAYFPLDPQLQK